MTFVRREIDVTFTLGEGQFGTDGSNSVTLTGLRINADIIKAGGPSMGTASLVIYGMTLDQMNKLSTLGMMPTLVRRNTVIVQVGDEGATKTTVFIGTITNAWADFRDAPENAFRVEAHTGLIEAVETSAPRSYKGTTDAAVVMASLATEMGLTFENSGVSVSLANPYFYGSPRNQAIACAQAGNFEMLIDSGRLAIWPKNGSRGGEAPLISKDTGMVGYPTYTSMGVRVETQFNPSIGFGVQINVRSILDAANGMWIVYNLSHRLSARVPGGPWFSTVEAVRPGLGPVVS